MTVWRSLEKHGFPKYDVSSEGEVRNIRTKNLVSIQQPKTPKWSSIAQRNILPLPTVTLWHESEDDGEKILKCRSVSVARLVALAFVEPEEPWFDQVVYKDRNRNNLHYWNLAWRPRWYANRMLRERIRKMPTIDDARIKEETTNIVYNDSLEAALAFGLLESDVVRSYKTGVRLLNGMRFV